MEAVNGNPIEFLGVLYLLAYCIKDFICRAQAFWGDEEGLRNLIASLWLLVPAEPNVVH